MFSKLLVANRGEIACRVIRSARRMGIASVAVFSEADAAARHARLADEAVAIGPSPAHESYLVGERIVAAARSTGAEAIHPGYGFLSENAAFAEACAAAGIVFVGPPVEAIRAMGSKSAAKALMERAGVPLVPGYHGDRQEVAFLAAEAARIGYPVLIKASAGGGGKGMRRVDAAADFEAALASCRREAANAFGSEQMLVEKYVLRPRHIEIQVFGDSHGRVIHLFERDCSVQRRHQKVLEEAPAPGMTAERRDEMGAAAVAAARAVGYVGAGTVEFIAQQDGRFWFMEMNTRLQVEHPVTESITGLDLVEWQLRVAAGEPLPLAQDDLRIDGHAIEARLYAEDPERGFLPSTGRILRFDGPPAHEGRAPADAAWPGIRFDAGVEAGDSITPFYDPMIGKLIAHGADRRQALDRLRRALGRMRLVGVRTNLAFLLRLTGTRSFAEADLDTALIEREAAALGASGGPPPEDAWFAAAVHALLEETERARIEAASAPDPDSPWRALDGWRLNLAAEQVLRLAAGERERALRVRKLAEGWRLSLDGGGPVVARVLERMGDGGLLLQIVEGEADGRVARRLRADVAVVGQRREVSIDGEAFSFRLGSAQTAAADEAVHGGLKAPMPGRIVALLASAGAAVEKGTPLLVMEAMKMEHTISAPHRGTVRMFRFAVGEQVEDGAELVDFEAVAEASAG